MNLKGNIKDSSTKEPLFGANIYVSDIDGNVVSPPKGTTTNPDGNYLFENVNPSDFITISYVGYKPYTFLASKVKDSTLNYDLISKSESIPVFEVIADKKNRNYFLISSLLLLALTLGSVKVYNEIKK